MSERILPGSPQSEPSEEKLEEIPKHEQFGHLTDPHEYPRKTGAIKSLLKGLVQRYAEQKRIRVEEVEFLFHTFKDVKNFDELNIWDTLEFLSKHEPKLCDALIEILETSIRYEPSSRIVDAYTHNVYAGKWVVAQYTLAKPAIFKYGSYWVIGVMRKEQDENGNEVDGVAPVPGIKEFILRSQRGYEIKHPR